jgi:hypothetical protein
MTKKVTPKKKATPNRNHWDNLEAREKATLAFVRFLREHPGEIPKCKKDGEYAKKKFAEGFFYLEGERQADPQHRLEPIPTETVFRVYEFAPPPPRDKLVTLVLPPEAQAIDEVEPTDVWLCTWAIWRE